MISLADFNCLLLKSTFFINNRGFTKDKSMHFYVHYSKLEIEANVCNRVLGYRKETLCD